MNATGTPAWYHMSLLCSSKLPMETRMPASCTCSVPSACPMLPYVMSQPWRIPSKKKAICNLVLHLVLR